MDRTGLKKPPVAPKPRVVPPSQPVARQKSFKHEDSKKISVKPLVAPKPCLAKIISEAKPLASKGELPKYFEQKSKIPGPEDLPKSRSGPHLEHKKPECDYLNPACVCAKGKCCDCLPTESRKLLQDGKFDKTCPNNRPQDITNPGSKIPSKPQRKKTEANKSLAPDSVQDCFTDHSRHGQNLIKAKGFTGSETHDRKPQNSGGGVQTHPPSVPGSVHKTSELKTLIVDKNEHRWTPIDQKDKSTSVLSSFRPEPPPAHSKPIKINAKTQLSMEDTPEVIADEVMNLKLKSVSKPPKPYNSTAKDSHQTPQRHKQKVYEDERTTTRDVGSAHNVHAREKLEGKATHKVVPQSEKQETNCSPSEVTGGKIPLPKFNLKTEPVPEVMERSNRYNKAASQLLLLDFKDEQAVLKEWHNDRNQNGHFTQPPVYRTHLNPVQETELEFSHPLPAFEQSVDGENFLQAAESVHQYENISEYVNIPLPASRERQLRQEEYIYEEMYVIPDELSEYSKSAQQKQRNVPENMISSDDDEMQDSSSEEEEDNNSNCFKGESQNGAKSTKRSHIAREIMSSEKVFVDVLKLLHIGFRDAVAKASCQAGKTLIEERVLNQILFYLPQLYELNCDLLRELEDRVAHWNEHSGIADIFLNKGPFLKMYSSYICEFDKNVALLEEQCRKNPAFAKVVQEFERSPCCANLAIKHYMLKPIQRIPQYQLLLTDYLKNLNENSQDYKKTQAALEIVKEVANHANETMKQGDNFQKLIQVQCRLLGNQEIVKPGRALLKEGTLMKLSRKVMQPRMFFLFNDLLLYTTPLQSGQYKLNNALSLAGMKVTKPNHEAHQNELRIESIERSFILSASSPAIRDSWLEAISNAIDEYAKKMISFNSNKSPEEVDRDCLDGTDQLGSKAPIWIPDLQVTMCMICTCEFTLTWRRHHCRACGKVVCSACSANKHHLEFQKKNKPARVCDQCFKTLQSNSPGPLSPNTKAIKASHARKQLKKTAKTLIEIPANTEESSMSGYLERMKANKKQWKKFWFVIKDKVLYTYAASEDQRALESLPLLGFHLEEDQSGSPNQFWLYHKNTLFYMFKSDDAHVYQRWVEAFSEATIL